jgi:hypothetical protein
MPNTRGNREDTHFVRRAGSDNYAPNEFAKCRVLTVMRLEADEEEKRKSVGTASLAVLPYPIRTRGHFLRL